MIQLGQTVRDIITGLVGVAVSRTEYLYGCVRIGVQPREIKDGRPAESTWIDEPQLEVVAEEPAIVPVAAAPAGPRDDARRARDAQPSPSPR